MLLISLAHAAPVCDTIDAFNTYMLDHAPTPSVTVEFDVTGVNPYAFSSTKGALVELTDTTCATGASNVIKVYGNEDPPNESHPVGTLKQEYGNSCCPSGDCGETWSDPNASAQVFFDGTESCVVFAWIDPDSFGYHLDCSSGVFDAYGVNDYDMPVDFIAQFYLASADTWYIESAVSTWDEVCWDAEVDPGDPGDTGDPGDDAGEGEYPALQDATAWEGSPAEVYPDAADLSVEAGDSVAFVQFDLSDVPGTITSAVLTLHTGVDGSSEGSGAVAWLADTTAWSENTLTWNNRPGAVRSLATVSPVSADSVYSWDVSAGLSSPGLVTFALAPPDGADNGSHFRAKEAGSGPTLQVTWVDDGGGGDETGIADDTDAGGDTGGDGLAEEGDPQAPGEKRQPEGCGCAAAPRPAAFAVVAALLLAGRRRSRAAWGAR